MSRCPVISQPGSRPVSTYRVKCLPVVDAASYLKTEGIAVVALTDARTGGTLRDLSGTEYSLTWPLWVLAGRYPRRRQVATVDRP